MNQSPPVLDEPDVLNELVVLDLGLGMSAALVSKFLGEAGATVKRLEPEEGDPFYSIYPAYEIWQSGKEIRKASGSDPHIPEDWLDSADICIVGGEDYPGLDWTFRAEALSERYPRLIVLDLQASPPVEGEEPLPANDLLAQARAGLSHEHYSDRPVAFNFKAPTFGAVYNGIAGVFAALIAREASGRGQVVSTSLVEGALDACRSSWFRAAKPDLPFMAMVPKDTRMTIFKCKDGEYVHQMMGTPGAKQRFYDLLGLNADEVTDTLDDRGMPTGRGDISMFWGDIDAFARPISEWTSTEFIALLQENDFPCVRVSQPGECWDLPQTVHNRIIKTDEQGTQYVGFPIKGL